jgi:hypothetical protein
MGLDKPPGERQPQARAGLPDRPVADLLELLEHPELVVLGDADPCVDDVHPDDVGHRLRRDRDRATLGGELDRVGEEVVEDLPEPAAIGVEHDLWVDLRLDDEPFSVGQRTETGHHLLDQRPDRELLDPQLEAPRLDPAQVEHVVDERQ